MDRDLIEKYLLITFLTLLFMFGAILGIMYGEKFKTQYILYNLNKEMISKNLTPLDDVTFNLGYNMKAQMYSDYDIKEYGNYLKQNYHYDELNYNCKYWSWNWALYSIKHNMNYKFVQTNDHIFLVSYNDNKYCVLDENNINCISLI